MKRDVHEAYSVAFDRIRVIHNGIDLNQYRPSPDPSVLKALQIDPDIPYVLFVGRITRQKGIIHLVNAIRHFQPGVQVVLCAGAPDTLEIAKEMAEAVDRARADSPHPIIWIREMLPKDTSSRSTRMQRSLCVRRCTNRSASSISKPWRVRRQLWRPLSAAFPRLSITGQPACWSRRK